jgi:hypothetical protein
MDSYNSNEGRLYCQLHFKQLLRPKPVDNQNDFDLMARKSILFNSLLFGIFMKARASPTTDDEPPT